MTPGHQTQPPTSHGQRAIPCPGKPHRCPRQVSGLQGPEPKLWSWKGHHPRNSAPESQGGVRGGYRPTPRLPSIVQALHRIQRGCPIQRAGKRHTARRVHCSLVSTAGKDLPLAQGGREVGGVNKNPRAGPASGEVHRQAPPPLSCHHPPGRRFLTESPAALGCLQGLRCFDKCRE